MCRGAATQCAEGQLPRTHFSARCGHPGLMILNDQLQRSLPSCQEQQMCLVGEGAHVSCLSPVTRMRSSSRPSSCNHARVTTFLKIINGVI